jgi:hypothetical protein
MESIKEKFHVLIDTIEDESQLDSYYSIISTIQNKEGEKSNENRYGKLYQKLTESQKKELEIAYFESFDEKNLIPHEEVKKKYMKWLMK